MFQHENKIKTGEKLSLERCKKVLNQDGLNYTDEEVKKIREFIYILAEIDYRLFKRKQEEKSNQIQKEKNIKTENNNLKSQTDETQSHSIHPREYRRAS